MAESIKEDKASISLNIISPSCPPVAFLDLPISSTILDLKTKIHETAQSHPPAETQRLIYRGHVLNQNGRTLKDIFTQEVINSTGNLTLHLVTPPVHPDASTSQAAPQAAPQASSQDTAVQHGPQQANSPEIVPPQHMTVSATFNGPPMMFQIPHPPAPPNGTYQIPQSTQSTPQNADNRGQHARQPGQPHPAHIHGLPHFQQHMQHFQAVQAQAQALVANQLASMQNHPAFQGQMPFPPGAVPAQPNQQAIRIQQGTPQQQSGQHNQPTQPLSRVQQGIPEQQTNQQNQPATHPHLPHAQHLGPQPHNPVPSANPSQHENAVNGQRWTVNPVNFPTPSQTFTSGTPVYQAFSRNQSAPSVTTQPHPGMDSQSGSTNAPSAAVYLLSSAEGPKALLVSPAGVYSTQWFSHGTGSNITAGNLPQRPITFDTAPNPGTPTTTNVPRAANSTQNNQARPPGNLAAQLPVQQQNPDAAAANQQQRDLARIVLHFSSHLWMLIRLFGFIWFFSHGASPTRTILLCSLATLVFIGQLGLGQGLWQTLRRHADNLLPLGGNEQANPATHRGPGTNPGSQEPSTQTTEDAARRLLEETQSQNHGIVRQTLRRFERAIALFLASLAPGVAERHIQAREAAEVARQRGIREREEQEKREEEARQKDAANVSEASGQSTSANTVSGNGASAEGQGPAQAPLIEV